MPPLSPPSAAIALQGVHASHGQGVLALQGIDLQVRAGEFLVLLGPSGCGKSTLLRLIGGLMQPSQGQVRVLGVAPDSHKARVAMAQVFQEPQLLPWATVLDNVAMPLRLRGMAPEHRRQKAIQALERVGLSDAALRLPRALSGGMRMRAALARALVARPRLLLMDEPFAALDEPTRHRLNDDLLALWRAEEVTVVFVTHSLSEAAYLGTRVLTLSGQPGRLVAEQTLEAPWPRPRDWRTSPDFNAQVRGLAAQLGAQP